MDFDSLQGRSQTEVDFQTHLPRFLPICPQVELAVQLFRVSGPRLPRALLACALSLSSLHRGKESLQAAWQQRRRLSALSQQPMLSIMLVRIVLMLIR